MKYKKYMRYVQNHTVNFVQSNGILVCRKTERYIYRDHPIILVPIEVIGLRAYQDYCLGKTYARFMVFVYTYNAIRADKAAWETEKRNKKG